MSTLDRLRALNQEVCRVWRRYYEEAPSEAEAEILNIGFRYLELVVEDEIELTSGKPRNAQVGRRLLYEYVQRVHAQFDSDADIKITEK